MPDEPIAIIGSGCRFPGGASSPSRLWEVLARPRDLATTIPRDRFNIDAFYHPDGQTHGRTNTRESYFLAEDVRAFDACFFNISAAEAENMDPQQRLLLETTYEALEAAGQTITGLQGSSTAVFCGATASDYEARLCGDLDALPRYAATGTARSILANRISYFFDWHGASMTVDTACSSSLVAVHLAVQELQTKNCTLAVAAGANLLLAPHPYVSEAKLAMLSPTGRGRMWDAQADGYARGEGVATIILKRLSDALAAGDPIECLIRATDINQDGRTLGLTMPSAMAQARLIRSTYRKAGLDPRIPRERCQYFEAHGTGTQAGDPQEARAIHDAFFGGIPARPSDGTLLVGSAKTVIGHTEATAGLAGVIKASLCLKHGLITPNLHFVTMNPEIVPYAEYLAVPTRLQPWPPLPPGTPRRVSVNSFGFGGTNAHAVLESYQYRTPGPSLHVRVPMVLPLVFSGPDERALRAVINAYRRYLDRDPTIHPGDLASSLMRRRSCFPHKAVFSAASMEQLRAEIREPALGHGPTTLVSRPGTQPKRILGVFTGQGAQWPQMGVELLSASPQVRGWIQAMQADLESLPLEYRPAFSLLDALSAGSGASRIHEAAVSQPLCTAVQIVLVNLVRCLGTQFAAVVGHSSGEIAAAYAAGTLTASEAIRIAHLRGHLAGLAGNNSGRHGAMLAVGMSASEAHALCQQPDWHGRLAVAAVNSPSLVTVSGDVDAVQEVEAWLKSTGRFARALRVDTAYHSHHMAPCAEPYLAALRACGLHPHAPRECAWFSSVYNGRQMTATDREALEAQYWVENMAGTVLFAPALETAATVAGPFDLIIEVGPHPALKGPTMETLASQDASSETIPYIGLLHRGTSAVETVAAAIGALWCHLGPHACNLDRYHGLFEPSRPLSFVCDLPLYPFDHAQSHWAESRMSRVFHHPRLPPSPLLGRLLDSAEEEWRWHNYLRPQELPWLLDHRIQSQPVLPAAAYICMALEAAQVLVPRGSAVRLLEVEDVSIDHAIQIDDSATGTETLFAVAGFDASRTTVSAHFTCSRDLGGTMRRCATGRITITLGQPDLGTLPDRTFPSYGFSVVDVDAFYTAFSRQGLAYHDTFRGFTSLERRRNQATGRIGTPTRDTPPWLHPAFLDTIFQSIPAAVGNPGDGRLYTLHVPRCVRRIVLNPAAHPTAGESDLAFHATVSDEGTHGFLGDVDVFDPCGHGILQVEGLRIVPRMPPSAQHDRLLFSETQWGIMHPDAVAPSSCGSGLDRPAAVDGDGASESAGLRRRAAAVVAQLAFRHAHLDILEIGGVQDPGDVAVLDLLDGPYDSYTITDRSPTVLEALQSRYAYLDNPPRFEVLDLAQDPTPQGWQENSRHDVVLLTGALPAEGSPSQALHHVRGLLKPGGYLVALQSLHLVPTVMTAAMDKSGQCVCHAGPARWDVILRDAGFSGLDTVALFPPYAVFASQAVDETISLLREPLASRPPVPPLQDLLIVGGTGRATSQLVAGTTPLLRPYFRRVTVERTWQTVDVAQLERAMVLALSELDQPYFQDLTAHDLSRLQGLLPITERLLWVTASPPVASPFQGMTDGLWRCVALEYPRCRFQTLYVDSPDALQPGLLATTFLQLALVDFANDFARSQRLWITEPELWLKDGTFQVPRIVPDRARNNRYMANRRAIFDLVSHHDQAPVELRPVDDGFQAVPMPPAPIVDTQVCLSVEYSTAAAIRVGDAGFFHLIVGRCAGTNDAVVALSSRHGSSVSVSSSWTWPCHASGDNYAGLLALVCSHLVARYLLSRARPGTSILVHEPDEVLRMCIQDAAPDYHVQPIFSTSSSSLSRAPDVVFLHEAAAARQVKAALPRDLSLIANPHGSTTNVWRTITRLVSCDVTRVTTQDLFRLCLSATEVVDEPPSWLAASLQSASAATVYPSAVIISLQDLLSSCIEPSPNRVIDWTSTHPVPVRVQPASAQVVLSPDKTYLLVGMTGDLGRSVGEWMISVGARNVVLASRAPKVEQWWLDKMAGLGATVHVLSMDVTDKESILRADEAIRETLPAVGGVVNGAMLPAERFFADLSFGALTEMLKPKQQGSLLLDELYSDPSLEFFILFGSVVGTTGNAGQSAYAAATRFMASVVTRRRARGLAASIINPAGIQHVGSLTHLGATFFTVLEDCLGFLPISEDDLREIFAEAILAGPVDSGRNPDIVAGVGHVNPRNQPRILWYPDPRLWHFIDIRGVRSPGSLTSDSQPTGSAELLGAARDLGEAAAILEDLLIAQVRKRLKLPAEQSLTAATVLVELGVDSLIAVELRTWFVTEIAVDVPVLKMLGGLSIGDLVSRAVWSSGLLIQLRESAQEEQGETQV